MAKKDKEALQNKMASFGDKMVRVAPEIPLQEEITIIQKKVEKPTEIIEEVGEKGFHLFIPMDVYWKVKETCVAEKTSMKNYINSLLLEDMKAKGKIKPK